MARFLAFSSAASKQVLAFQRTVVPVRRVLVAAAAREVEEEVVRRQGASKRAVRRGRKRTIDFTRPLQAQRPAPQRAPTRVDALVESDDDAPRAEKIAALLLSERNVFGEHPETRLECVVELLRLRRPDLARTCCAATSSWREAVHGADAARLHAFGVALCRSGLEEELAAVVARLWPSPRFAAIDERDFDDYDDKVPLENDDDARLPPRPARLYAPLVIGYLRRGKSSTTPEQQKRQDAVALAAIDSWRRAELAIRRQIKAGDTFESLTPQPFNVALREAHKARSLAAVFAVLDVMAAAGVRGDDETFEIIGNVGARNVRFVTGAVGMDSLPAPESYKEAVFVGRSNVGKSSLVNMVTNRRATAFISKRPGKTQQFNFFEVNGFDSERKKGPASAEETASTTSSKKKKTTAPTFVRKPPWRPRGRFYLVDVPGLGYAEVPDSARRDWASFLEVYLQDRLNVAFVFHLVDSRHGPTPVDREIWAMIHRATQVRAEGRPPLRFAVVLTKADKRSAKVTHPAKTAIRDELAGLFGADAANNVPILVTSAESRRGRDAMWRYLRLAIDC